MAGQPHLITQRMVELRYGSKVVRDYLDHDRSGRADPERVEEVLGEASDVIRGLMLPGFSLPSLQELITRDKAVRGYCCAIFMGVAAQQRPALMNAEGMNPFIKLQERSEKKLKEIAAANERRGGREEETGRNRKLGVSTNRNPLPSVFQQTKSRRNGPGGF
jgi:phage gp36-like protein